MAYKAVLLPQVPTMLSLRDVLFAILRQLVLLALLNRQQGSALYKAAAGYEHHREISSISIILNDNKPSKNYRSIRIALLVASL